MLSEDVLASLRPARPVIQVGLVAVVGATAELNVLYRRLTTNPEGLHVVEFEKGPRAAPPSVCSHEGAAITVSQPHRPLDLRRNVADGRGGRAAGPRPLGFGELLSGQALEQRGERAIDDLRNVSVGNRVSKEILGEP
jgi:hypothetical protein